MKPNPAAVLASLDEFIWRTPGAPVSPRRALVMRLLRLVIVLVRDIAFGQLTLRAMGLVYTTLLSIVPLLAISFSVLKAFGVYNQIRPALLRFLEPLGEKGVEITARIMQFIENINVGVLGSVGLALLLYTAVSLVHKVEESFNYIWHVSRGRSIGERFSRYVSALLVGPLLVFSAIGITAAVAGMSLVRDAMEIEAINWLMLQLGRLLPYALVIAAFTFLYTFMPNTRVRLGPALAGGVVGGIAWQSAGWAFAQFAAASTRYSAIYSSFAILILFMLWLYLNWLILLFGSSVSFYFQHPEYLVKKGGEPRLSNRMREYLALAVMSLIGKQHLAGSAPLSVDMLARELRMPMRSVDEVLTALQARGILATTGEEPPGWLPVQDLDRVSAKDVLDTVRTAGEAHSVNVDALPGMTAVERLVQEYDDAAGEALKGVSISELAGLADGPDQVTADRDSPLMQ